MRYERKKAAKEKNKKTEIIKKKKTRKENEKKWRNGKIEEEAGEEAIKNKDHSRALSSISSRQKLTTWCFSSSFVTRRSLYSDSLLLSSSSLVLWLYLTRTDLSSFYACEAAVVLKMRRREKITPKTALCMSCQEGKNEEEEEILLYRSQEQT